MLRSRNFICLSQRLSSTGKYWKKNSYNYFAPVQLRWRDNDLQGNVKESVYTNCMISITQGVFARYNAPDKLVLTSSRVSQRSPLSYPNSVLAGFAVKVLDDKTIETRVAFFPGVPRDSKVDDWRVEADEPNVALENFESTASAVGAQKIQFRTRQSRGPVDLPLSVREAVGNHGGDGATDDFEADFIRIQNS